MPSNTNPTRRFSDLRRLDTEQLTAAEQFVLGACRCWDAFMLVPDRSLAWRQLAPAFAYMNVLHALCAFDCAFAHLHSWRPHNLRFQDADCRDVAIDEARLLCGVACLQRGMARAAVDVLRDSLPQACIRAVLHPLARIAAILDVAGHRLPGWQSAVSAARVAMDGHPGLARSRECVAQSAP